MDERNRKAVVNRLKTARGHIDAVIGMVEDDAYMEALRFDRVATSASVTA